MNHNDIKKELSSLKTQILAESFSLYQRSLISEIASWIRQVEAKAKQLKTGKVILVAIFKDE
jgi:hypothetical protein